MVLSGFDPVRREIAREAMERLILDGRIHPARIEEVVGKVAEEMDEVILRTGNEAVMKLGLAPMHVEIVKLLGRLHFRHSFSQNILNHSVEVAQFMGLMAAELGVDVAAGPARRVAARHRQGGEPRGGGRPRPGRRGDPQALRRGGGDCQRGGLPSWRGAQQRGRWESWSARRTPSARRGPGPGRKRC